MITSFLSEFKVHREAIPETDGWMSETILHLVPFTDYDFRLRATNQRQEMPNFSEYVETKAKTKGENNYIWICAFPRLIKFNFGNMRT